MRGAALTAAALIVAIAGSAPASSAQWLKDKTPGIPRTADGKPDFAAPAPRSPDGTPDLSGIWRVDPGGYSDDLAVDLKPGEVLPWAAALVKQRSEEFAISHPMYRCLPEIGPLASFGMFKILQTPGTTGVLSENGRYRQILTDGRALPVDPNPTWAGYSVGRWEGDVLVVTSAGFNDKTWLDYAGHPHTEALRVTERYRRKTFGELEVQMTFEDPNTYARPWTISLTGRLAADTELLEYVCNENEKSVQRFLVTEDERRRVRTAHVVPVEVLRRYLGDYEMEGPGGKQTYVVELAGNELSVRPPRGGRWPLVAGSDTVFWITGQRLEFFLDASGQATHFVMTIVEGDLKGVRK